MSPMTSIPVCRISVAIGVTSNSSTLHRCWISPPANVVSRHHTCLPSAHGIGVPSAGMFVRPCMGDMAKRSFACPPSVTTLEPVAPHRAMASCTATSSCESSSAGEMPSGSASLPRSDPRRRPWHTSSRVARHCRDHSTPCIGVPMSRQALSHATKASVAPHRWSLSGASVGLREPAGAASATKPHGAPLRADA